MYIPEFWIGVAATILLEVAALFAYAAFTMSNKKK